MAGGGSDFWSLPFLGKGGRSPEGLAALSALWRDEAPGWACLTLPLVPQQAMEGFPTALLGLMPITHISEVIGTLLATGGFILAPREGILQFAQAACLRVPCITDKPKGPLSWGEALGTVTRGAQRLDPWDQALP